MKYTRSEAIEAASSLYDGGWRVDDKEELMKEHELSAEDAEIICDELRCLGEESKK